MSILHVTSGGVGIMGLEKKIGVEAILGAILGKKLTVSGLNMTQNKV